MLSIRSKKVISILLMLITVLAFAGCAKGISGSAQADKTETAVDRIKKAGKLVLGTSADYPPYEFHSVTDGKDEIVGFDIAIAKEIAKDLGVELEIKDMKFDGLLAALETENVDLVIAGMTPTEERKKSVDFSNVYYNSEQAIVVNAENKEIYSALDDLKGKKIGVQKGTIQEEIAGEEIENAELKSLGKVSDLVLELLTKKVDALVIEYPVAAAYASQNPKLTVSEAKFSKQDKGNAIAIKKGSSDLVDAVNKTLERLMADNAIDEFIKEAGELAIE